jgi:cysteine-rich repeat protein
MGAGYTGTLSLKADCTGFVTTGCIPPAVSCGNGVVETGEQCDDGNTNNNDICLNNCKWAFCGDSIACTSGCSPLEVCDGADLNGATCASVMGAGYTGTLSCLSSCAGYVTTGCVPPAVCGNGILETGEQCDDGNTANGDGCSSTCTIETNPDTSAAACAAATDTTPGNDAGKGYGATLFDDASNYGTPNCCGDDAGEYYLCHKDKYDWTTTTGFLCDTYPDTKMCCDQWTDCADGTGFCYNHLNGDSAYYCLNSVWYRCTINSDVGHIINNMCCTSPAPAYETNKGFKSVTGGLRETDYGTCSDGLDNDCDGAIDSADKMDCPTLSTYITSAPLSSTIKGVSKGPGNYVYVASQSSGLYVYDVGASSANLAPCGSYTSGNKEYNDVFYHSDSNNVFVANGQYGYKSFSSGGCSLTFNYNDDPSINSATGIFAANYIYVSDGDKIIISSGPGTSTSFSANSEHVFVEHYQSTGEYYLFTASGGGMTVYNANSYPPSFKTSYSSGAFFHNVYVETYNAPSGPNYYAYLAGDTGGLYIVNVTNVSNPTCPPLVELAHYDTPGEAWDVAVTQASNGRIYAAVADGTTGVLLFDVTNKASPKLVTTYKPINTNYRSVDAFGDYIYIGTAANIFLTAKITFT